VISIAIVHRVVVMNKEHVRVLQDLQELNVIKGVLIVLAIFLVVVMIFASHKMILALSL